MAITLEQFTAQLAESGIMTREEICAFAASLPPEMRVPEDSQSFARELIRAQKLTPFQAAAISRNKGRSLQIGPYLVLDKIGQGGMGTVFKAELCRMNRIVALKILSGRAVDSPEAVPRFLREVQAAARLTHENIVAALDAGEVHGAPYLVMEYVEGTDLSDLVKTKGPLPVATAVDCIVQAARGLAHAHGAGVIHREKWGPPVNLRSGGAHHGTTQSSSAMP